MSKISPSQWEFLASLGDDWELCDTVQDGIVVGLEVAGYIESDMRKLELPAGGLSTSYKRYARITAAGVVALHAHAVVAA